MPMKNTIGVRELREETAKYAKRVQKGESFIVLKHARPLFRIGPVDEEAGWETIIDFTKIRKGGIPVSEVLRKLKAL